MAAKEEAQLDGIYLLLCHVCALFSVLCHSHCVLCGRVSYSFVATFTLIVLLLLLLLPHFTYGTLIAVSGELAGEEEEEEEEWVE